jgi:thioredoxin-related protein
MRAVLLVAVGATTILLLAGAPPGPRAGTVGGEVTANAAMANSPAPKSPEVEWLEYGEALDRAKRENKHLIVDFYTNWCGWCRRMDHDTYGDSAVATYLSAHFVLAKVNAESPKRIKVGESTKSGIELAREFGVNSFPITWFIKPDGTKIDKLMGYQAPGPFRNVLVFVHERRYERN